MKKISRTVGIISYTTPKTAKDSAMSYFGTGTIICRRLDSIRGVMYLITNKHVLPNSKESDHITFRIINQLNGNDSFSSVDIPIYESGQISKEVRFDPLGEDLAAINISSYFARKSIPLQSYYLSTELLTTPKKLDELGISIGDDVFFIGFPNFLYNKKNISPILRVGTISTDPSTDYYFNKDVRQIYFSRFKTILTEKFTGFLMDGSVFGGSSGSLVMVKPQSVYVSHTDQVIDVGQEMPTWILGIATTSYFDLDSRSANGVRLNLAGVISSSVILRTIDSFAVKN